MLYKSPLRHPTHKNLSLGRIKELVPVGHSVDTYNFYDGQLEINLASHDRRVYSYTTSYYVYEFWKCLENDRDEVYHKVTSDYYKFDALVFPLLQDTWYTYRIPNVRAALFYILSLCSSSGRASSGDIDYENFHSLALQYLKTYKKPPNLEIFHRHAENIESAIDPNSNADFLLFPNLKFSYNLFDEGKSRAWEETAVNHRTLRHTLSEITEHKWILTYMYHPALSSFFQSYNTTLIGEFGNVVNDAMCAREMVICNF